MNPKKDLQKNISAFLRERNRALFSLDRRKIEKYMAKYGCPLPDNDTVFWAGVHKAICNINSAPPELVRNSKAWLKAHGMTWR